MSITGLWVCVGALSLIHMLLPRCFACCLQFLSELSFPPLPLSLSLSISLSLPPSLFLSLSRLPLSHSLSLSTSLSLTLCPSLPPSPSLSHSLSVDYCPMEELQFINSSSTRSPKQALCSTYMGLEGQEPVGLANLSSLSIKTDRS